MMTLSGLNTVAANYPSMGASVTRSTYDLAVERTALLTENDLGKISDDLVPLIQILIDSNAAWRSHFLTVIALRLIEEGRCRRAWRSYHRRPA